MKNALLSMASAMRVLIVAAMVLTSSPAMWASIPDASTATLEQRAPRDVAFLEAMADDLASAPVLEEQADVFVERPASPSAAELPPPEKPHLGSEHLRRALHRELALRNSQKAAGMRPSEAENGGGFTFSGKYYDREANLFYFNARYYDPDTGRFISKDGFDYGRISEPPSLHLYYYALANPLRYVDLDGHQESPAGGSESINQSIGDAEGAMVQSAYENIKRDEQAEKEAAGQHGAVVAKEADPSLSDRVLGAAVDVLKKAWERYGGKAYRAAKKAKDIVKSAVDNKPALTDFDEATPGQYKEARDKNLREMGRAAAKAKEAAEEGGTALYHIADDGTVVYGVGGVIGHMGRKAEEAAIRRALKRIGEKEVAEEFEAASRVGSAPAKEAWREAFGEGSESEAMRTLRKAPSAEVEEARRAGIRAHAEKAYPPGYEREHVLPSGRRADAINFDEKKIIERKPNNPRAIAEGRKQVQQYCAECDQVYGERFTGTVETYEPGAYK